MIDYLLYSVHILVYSWTSKSILKTEALYVFWRDWRLLEELDLWVSPEPGGCKAVTTEGQGGRRHQGPPGASEEYGAQCSVRHCGPRGVLPRRCTPSHPTLPHRALESSENPLDTGPSCRLAVAAVGEQKPLHTCPVLSRLVWTPPCVHRVTWVS